MRLRGGLRVDYTTTDEVLQWCIGMDPGKHGKAEQMRVAAIMKRLGWKQARPLVDGVKDRRWVRASVDKGEARDATTPPF